MPFGVKRQLWGSLLAASLGRMVYDSYNQVVDMAEMNREELLKEIESVKQEHATLDARVEAFNQQVWMSPEDQVAQKERKKLKLKAKERLTALQEELAALDKA